MKVWIAQYLCGPQRHAIMAAADEAKDRDEAETKIATALRNRVADLLRAEAINPWCALCGAASAEWIVDLQPSRFRTLDEALPTMRQAEADQAATNAAFGDLHRTQRKN
jgi:hypothetical protein